MKNSPLQTDLSTLEPKQGFKLSGSLTGGLFGASARNLGDINQDGISDIIIGASGQKRAYVLFGSNGWACDVCGTASTCKTCQPGYNYTYNGKCYWECPVYAPYKIGSQCFSEDPEEISSEIKDGVTGGAAATTVANRMLNLWSPSDALPFIYGQLKASVMYFRYLNITRTQKLEELYQLFYDTDTSVIPFVSMSESIKDAFPNENLPYMFRKYSLPSSFMANFGDDFMGLAIIFACLITTKVASFLVKKYIRNLPSLRIILHRASVTFQNFFVGSFAEALGPIIFYSAMEFRNQRNPEKEYYVTSLLICVLSIILGLTALIICGWILNKFQATRKISSISQKRKTQIFESLEKKYEGFGVFFEEFENSSLFHQSAFLLFTFRSVAESLIVGLFFEYPLTQAILLVMLTSLLLIYITVKKPFKNKLSLAQQLVLILSLFICNLCLAIMAGTDRTYKNFQSVKEHTSQIIFWALVMFQFIPLFFFTIGLVENAWKLYKWFSKMRNLNAKKGNINAKRATQDFDQSSILSLDQTVLSLNESRVQLKNVVRHSRPRIVRNQSNEIQIDPLQRQINLQKVKMGPQLSDVNNNTEIFQAHRIKKKIKRPHREISH